VTACSDYADRRLASIREMEEIAWVLRSDARRNQVGFVPARKLKPADRYVLPGDWDDGRSRLSRQEDNSRCRQRL
jgi:hypothetical protein